MARPNAPAVGGRLPALTLPARDGGPDTKLRAAGRLTTVLAVLHDDCGRGPARCALPPGGPMGVPYIPALVSAALLLAACERSDAPDSTARTAAECEAPAVRDVVERFGRALQQVPLLAPDSVFEAQMRRHYEPLVTPALFARWMEDPAAAPGRETSSPWPDRIAIDSVTTDASGACVVHGAVVYATSADPDTGVVLHAPARLHVRGNAEWRIADYRQGELSAGRASPGAHAPPDQHLAPDAAPQDPADGTPQDGAADRAGAAAVVQRYYDAIAARDYARAYASWSGAGAASGQTAEEFAAGFAATESVAVEIGTPSRPEGAAGSVYVRVPVVVRARTVDGPAQRFEGTYTLRRSTVDGATPQQQAWRIHSAALRRVS